MFNVFVDTCVWLDLAENPKQTPLLDPLVALVSDGYANILVPSTVLHEFKANRARVAKSSEKSLSTHFNLVKDAIRKADGDKRQKDKVLGYLSDIDHRIPLIGGAAKATLDSIEVLLSEATPIGISDAVKIKAADRALNRKAPCHQNKNSMADAVLIETYFECVKNGKPGDRFAFVTHNHTDFSLVNGNRKLPHADLAAGFSKIKSLYFITLGECLRRIDPHIVSEVMFEYGFELEPRALSEILDAADRLTTEVWHNRNMNTQWALDHGKHKIVTQAEWDSGWAKNKAYGQTHTIDTIWKGALKSRAKARKKLGEGNYGPYTDFEWGMINGKLSALRWMLGEDWDELYT
jgi:hypothetical protein